MFVKVRVSSDSILDFEFLFCTFRYFLNNLHTRVKCILSLLPFDIGNQINFTINRKQRVSNIQRFHLTDMQLSISCDLLKVAFFNKLKDIFDLWLVTC